MIDGETGERTIQTLVKTQDEVSENTGGFNVLHTTVCEVLTNCNNLKFLAFDFSVTLLPLLHVLK